MWNHCVRHLSLGFCGAMLLSLLLIACSAGAGTPPAPQSATTVTTARATMASSSTVQLSPTVFLADTIAIVRRSGGVAGVTQEFVFKRDGTVLSGSNVRKVEGGAAAATILAEKISATGIYDVQPGKYFPTETCCDRQTFELTLTKDGKTYNFTTLDDTIVAPPPLRATMNLLQEYINAAH